MNIKQLIRPVQKMGGITGIDGKIGRAFRIEFFLSRQKADLINDIEIIIVPWSILREDPQLILLTNLLGQKKSSNFRQNTVDRYRRPLDSEVIGQFNQSGMGFCSHFSSSCVGIVTH